MLHLTLLATLALLPSVGELSIIAVSEAESDNTIRYLSEQILTSLPSVTLLRSYQRPENLLLPSRPTLFYQIIPGEGIIKNNISG